MEIEAWRRGLKFLGALILLAISAGILSIMLAFAVRARDLAGQYAGSPMSDWYAKQRNARGDVCCDDADGHPDPDWGRQSAGYWVEFEAKRHDVPAWALVSGAHPQGKAVVWIFPKGTDTVRCFLPGMEG